MKQKIVSAFNIAEFQEILENAISFGWKVKTISSNQYGWVAVLES